MDVLFGDQERRRDEEGKQSRFKLVTKDLGRTVKVRNLETHTRIKSIIIYNIYICIKNVPYDKEKYRFIKFQDSK